MTLKVSTGLRNAVLATGSIKSVFEAGNGGHIRVFSGAVPADADAAETGTLLCIITTSGLATGTAGSTLMFAGAATAGVLSKAATPWSGTNVASGTPSYYRHVATGDTGALSTTAARIQGNVAILGAEMSLSVSSLTSGVAFPLDSYNISLPSL